MKRRFLLSVALLLLVTMLLPGLSFAEGLQAVTDQTEQAVNLQSDPLPEEQPEFELVAPDFVDNNNTCMAVEAVPISEETEGIIQSKAATPTQVIVGMGEAYTLKITGAVKYRSSNKNVATVSRKGVITNKKTGNTIITVTDKNGKKTRINVTVKKAPKKVTLNKTKKTLEVDETYQLKATLPSGTASALTWNSSNKKVAKVDSKGKVTALKAGTAKITVKTFNGKKATCTITVNTPSKKGYSGDIWDAIGADVHMFSNYIDDPLVLLSYEEDYISYMNAYMMVNTSFDDTIIAIMLLTEGDKSGKYTISGIYPGLNLATSKMLAEKDDWTYSYTKNNVYYYTALYYGDEIKLAISSTGSAGSSPIKSVLIFL